MQQIFASLLEVGSDKDWLITANFILSVLLGMWMLRYRKLYFSSREEQGNNLELIEHLSEGIYRSSPDGRQLSANRALVKLNGYSSEEEMLAGITDIGKEWYVEQGRRDEFRAILRRDGRVDDFVSEVYRHKTRERIWITESARLVHHKKTGKALYYEGSVREITETVNRLKLEEQIQKLTSQLPGALFQFVVRANGTAEILYASAGLTRITGLTEQEYKERPQSFSELVRPDDVDAFRLSLWDAAAKMEGWDHEFRIQARDGSEKWVRVTAQPELVNGDLTWHGYFNDISVRKRNEMEIEALAFYDPLTGLPNRRLFRDRMGQAVAGAERRGDCGALLFIDLDNFKTLNDTQGHDVGDAFLIQVADRLKRCVGLADTVARIGGDEFVVIIEEAGNDQASSTRRAVTAANQILAAFRGGFELGALNHAASASIGVVVFDGAAKRVDDILKRADIAMYQAKAAGRNAISLFDPATMDREAERYQLLNELRIAFDSDDQLELHYHVQVDDDRQVVGAEALIRWRHPRLGMVYPDRFVPLAEQFGLNDLLTQFVLARGVETLAAWQRESTFARMRLALNVSVQSFNSADFVPMLTRLIDATGIDATMLTLELTEHVMANDHPRVARQMADLKKLGVRLSLDDFGTGYSSLTYLKTLPFDELKIDGGFVSDIETTESDRALVKTILAMARTLGLSAVAEHVENVRQESFLRAFGCDYFQGYLYAKPIPLEALMEYVSGGRPEPTTIAFPSHRQIA
ncbi:MAG: putative bifunctional diguanylate cyclase/phosphodiesterase [Rhizobiaceae bacterium]